MTKPGQFHSKCNYKKLLRCSGEEKNATRLHGVLAKFADRKIARIFRLFNFSAIFRRCCIASAKHTTHRNLYLQNNA